jgi:hypothetical protein
MYQSDFTKFMDAFLTQHPEVVSQRETLRLTLWDRTVDPEDLQRWNASRVAQKPYVYQAD